MGNVLDGINKAVGSTEQVVFLTSVDKSNFRFELYPEYKANRTSPKPKWYAELRAWLQSEVNAVVVSGREADDAIADAQITARHIRGDDRRGTSDSNINVVFPETIICTIDKDLDQIPGWHYDFVKDVKYEVNGTRGTRFFYLQLLTGDRTDNIPGIPGMGPKRSAQALGSEWRADKLHDIVRRHYSDTYGKQGDELMLLYGRLLKIGGDLWDGEVLERGSINQNLKQEPDLSSKSEDFGTKDTSLTT